MASAASSSSLAEALASLSVKLFPCIKPPRRPAAVPLTFLPTEINVGIAAFLDHESLVGLGKTCSTLRRLVLEGVDSLWKTLHDERWRSGKRLRLDGPPSRRPRGGTVLVEGVPTWRDEFVRRFVLDERVPLLLGRVEEINDALSTLLEAGADIYDRLKLLCKDRECSTAANKVMIRINHIEALADWMMLHYAPNKRVASVEDGMMVISKLYQSSEDLLERHSSDAIYDEINVQLDRMSPEDVEAFEVVSDRELPIGDVDLILLDKVLKNRRGRIESLFTIVASVNEKQIRSVDRENILGCDDMHLMKRYVEAEMAGESRYHEYTMFLGINFIQTDFIALHSDSTNIAVSSSRVAFNRREERVCVYYDALSNGNISARKLYDMAEEALDENEYWVFFDMRNFL